MVLSGCGASTQLNLKFSPEASTSYKASTAVIKDFRFEQPNLGKLREEQTKTEVAMAFTQTIESVDADGVATAKITIDGLKVQIINKNEDKFAFDSQSEEDKDAPLAKLIGQSYTIKITPSGKVASANTAQTMLVVGTGYDKQVAQSILDPKAITKYHEITALPEDGSKILSVDDTWSQVVPSPPGLLAPKSYEKTYTLTSVDNNIATVSMQAGESGETAPGQTQAGGSMGVFAKMFDNVDTYTGSMKINVTSGEVLEYDETLVSTYTAQEMPQNGDTQKGPDTLMMRFTNRVHLEKLD